MRDPYHILGLAKGAGADEIKKAYRQKAKKLHPDQNQNDPQAHEKFAELNGAYELLSDDDKRRAFDRGEIDAEGKPKMSGFSGFSGHHSAGGGPDPFEQFVNGAGFRRSAGGKSAGNDDFFDMFARMTGGRAGGASPFDEFSTQRRASDLDVTLTLTVPFLEAARGGAQRVMLHSGGNVDITLPAGTRDGHKLRLKGKGKTAPSGQKGDVYVLIKVEPHPHFKAEGKDVRLDLPVALDEAILGATIRVPTLDGAVDLKLPPMSSSGKQFRLKGKGLPSSDGAGDLYIIVKIVLPEGDQAALEQMAQNLKAHRNSDPRANLV